MLVTVLRNKYDYFIAMVIMYPALMGISGTIFFITFLVRRYRETSA